MVINENVIYSKLLALKGPSLKEHQCTAICTGYIVLLDQSRDSHYHICIFGCF